MFENRSSGPRNSLAASIAKCGNAQTGMLKMVIAGRSAAKRRASRTASTLLSIGPEPEQTSWPASRKRCTICPFDQGDDGAEIAVDELASIREAQQTDSGQLFILLIP